MSNALLKSKIMTSTYCVDPNEQAKSTTTVDNCLTYCVDHIEQATSWTTADNCLTEMLFAEILFQLKQQIVFV